MTLKKTHPWWTRLLSHREQKRRSRGMGTTCERCARLLHRASLVCQLLVHAENTFDRVFNRDDSILFPDDEACGTPCSAKNDARASRLRRVGIARGRAVRTSGKTHPSPTSRSEPWSDWDWDWDWGLIEVGFESKSRGRPTSNDGQAVHALSVRAAGARRRAAPASAAFRASKVRDFSGDVSGLWAFSDTTRPDAGNATETFRRRRRRAD